MRLIKNLYLSKQYGARRLLSELPTRVGNLKASTVCSAEENPQDGTIVRQPGSGRPRLSRRDDNTENVEDLVLSQADKPKRNDQLVIFLVKLPFSVQVCTG